MRVRVLILDFRLRLFRNVRDEGISRARESSGARRKPACADGHKTSHRGVAALQKISQGRRAPLAPEAPSWWWWTRDLRTPGRTGECLVEIRLRCCVVG